MWRTLCVLCASALAKCLAADSAAAVCDPLLADLPALVDTEVDVPPGGHAARRLPILAGVELIIFAREQGLDVTLTIVDGAGHTLAGADNPIRRTGIQRVDFVGRQGVEYSADIVAREDHLSGRPVRLRVVNVSTQPPKDSCTETHRLLARADGALAAAETPPADTGNASAASESAGKTAAAAAYRAAAVRLADSRPSALLAQVQHAIAALSNDDLEDWSGAEEWARNAAQTYGALGDDYDKERANTIQAAALIDLAVSPASPSAAGTLPQTASKALAGARALLRAAAKFHAGRGQPYDQAIALNYIGVAYLYEGATAAAIRAWQGALPLYQRLRDRVGQAQVLQNTAAAEYELGRVKDAIALYGEVLRLITPSENPMAYVYVLDNLANANRTDGDMDAALRQYGEALQLNRALHDPIGEGYTLHGLGSLYEALGDRGLALEFYGQALALRKANVDGPARAATLRAIGNILREQGQPEEALRRHHEALDVAANAYTIDRIRVQIAQDLDQLGQPQEAQEQLRPVLGSGTAAGSEAEHAHALRERSHAYLLEHNAAAAESDLLSALQIFRKYELAADEFEAWVDLASLQRQRGADEQAFRSVDKALALAEDVRAQSANPELRATLMQPLRRAFDLRIAMLADRAAQRPGQPTDAAAREALETAEQARMRALQDFSSLDLYAAGVSPKLVQERQALYKQLAVLRFQVESLLDHSGTDDSRVRRLRSDVALLRQRVDQLDAEAGAASVARQRETKRLDKTATFDGTALPGDTAVIEYWLGADAALAWVVTRDRLAMIRLGSSSEISAAARAFHIALRNLGSVPTSVRLDAGERLYELIFRPLDKLVADKHTLIFVPDGALHYVPFAALRVPGGASPFFLVQTHDIAVTSSIGVLLNPLIQDGTRRAAKQMLLVDDPVYSRNDARLSVAAEPATTSGDIGHSWQQLSRGTAANTPLPRLPGTRQEAAAIAALFPKGEIDQLEGFSATREQFLRSDLGGYRFIHIASHAITDAEIPQLSALVFSTVDRHGSPIDGRVLAADFMNQRIHAEAVVLSACDTAMGKDIAGEGLIGLRYLVLARGAGSVVSSLWQVPDRATAQLMARFYSALLQGHSSVTAASSAAMRDMLNGPFTDPALWAAFSVTVRMSSGRTP
jgi:CHAT domain-containing protein